MTLDVKSIHTNILSKEGIKDIKKGYDEHPNKTFSKKVFTFFLLSLIVALNNSIFNKLTTYKK